MRIAFVTCEYVTEPSFDGGLANYIHRVALSLKSLGHEPLVIVASDRDENFIHKGIAIYRVDVNCRFPLTLINIMTFLVFNMLVYLYVTGKALNRKVSELHKQNPIDIIQYTHLGGLSLFKNVDIPSVIRLSSYTPLARAQGGYEFSHPLLLRQQEFVERRALMKSRAVFGPSRIICRIVQQEMSRRITIIESPFILDTTDLDTSLFKTQLEGSEYLLFFGALSVLKGVVTIADILYPLLSCHPNLKFVLVGKQIADYQGAPMMNYVWNQARECRDRVIYLGQLHHEQLYPIIANARAVVLPSRIDNFPNACLEAMAFRRVVIGTRGTSFEQLLIDGVSGLLCEIGDTKSLLSAIERALGFTDEERAKMGDLAAARIKELSPERVVQQLLDFYSDVIRGAIPGEAGQKNDAA